MCHKGSGIVGTNEVTKSIKVDFATISESSMMHLSGFDFLTNDVQQYSNDRNMFLDMEKNYIDLQ